MFCELGYSYFCFLIPLNYQSKLSVSFSSDVSLTSDVLTISCRRDRVTSGHSVIPYGIKWAGSLEPVLWVVVCMPPLITLERHIMISDH